MDRQYLAFQFCYGFNVSTDNFSLFTFMQDTRILSHIMPPCWDLPLSQEVVLFAHGGKLHTVFYWRLSSEWKLLSKLHGAQKLYSRDRNLL